VQRAAAPKLPFWLVEKLTAPDGVLVGPPSVSVTVAVQLVALATSTDGGEHVTDVVVERNTVGVDILVKNTSMLPPLALWALPAVVGKSVDPVDPVT
jgi:hypothetical protein